MATDATVLLIGGRSGVGKTSVAFEASELLQAAGVPHCLIDGDNLAAAYPKPPEDPHGTALAELNSKAVWASYAALGHTRAIYVNTVSVLEAPSVRRAMGGASSVRVLLTAEDDTTAARLAGREIGSALDEHISRSMTMAAHLQAQAGLDVPRVATDGRTVAEVARDVLRTCGWLGALHRSPVEGPHPVTRRRGASSFVQQSRPTELPRAVTGGRHCPP